VSDSAAYTGHNLVFIVGCERSGTTYLQRLLASNAHVKTGQESYLFSWYLGPMARQWYGEELRTLDREHGGGVGMRCYLTEEEFRNLLQEFMMGLLKPMIGQLKDGDIFLEKTPLHSLWIPEIVKLLPKARFIHIFRDARDNVASMLEANRSGWGKSWGPRHAYTAARWWVRYEKAIENAKALLPANSFYEITYEGLRESAMTALSGLRDFLHLDWSTQQMEDAIARNSPERVEKEGTKIIRSGEYGRILGEVTKSPEGFIRKAKPGSWKNDLKFYEKWEVWLFARKTMAARGYPWKFPW
jgi:hypothetical protein